MVYLSYYAIHVSLFEHTSDSTLNNAALQRRGVTDPTTDLLPFVIIYRPAIYVLVIILPQIHFIIISLAHHVTDNPRKLYDRKKLGLDCRYLDFMFHF